jgi:hypothetical protein
MPPKVFYLSDCSDFCFILSRIDRFIRHRYFLLLCVPRSSNATISSKCRLKTINLLKVSFTGVDLSLSLSLVFYPSDCSACIPRRHPLPIVAYVLQSVHFMQHAFLMFFVSYFSHCLVDLIAEIQQGLWKKPPLALTSEEIDACNGSCLGETTINSRHLGPLVVF